MNHIIKALSVKIIAVWLFTTSWTPIKHTVFIVCASTPMHVYVPACYFQSSLLKTSWLSGSCKTRRRPWDGAQPIQTLYMHKIHRWKFNRISKKCFPHVTIPPPPIWCWCWDSSFGDMISWENYPALSNSEHTQLGWHTQRTHREVCVCVCLWAENYLVLS